MYVNGDHFIYVNIEKYMHSIYYTLKQKAM